MVVRNKNLNDNKNTFSISFENRKRNDDQRTNFVINDRCVYLDKIYYVYRRFLLKDSNNIS